jgi:hypothetical protein
MSRIGLRIKEYAILFVVHHFLLKLIVSNVLVGVRFSRNGWRASGPGDLKEDGNTSPKMSLLEQSIYLYLVGLAGD